MLPLKDVIPPRARPRLSAAVQIAGVIAIPLEARTDAEIVLLANLITLTPGTLSLDISADRKVLYVHAMYIDGGDLDQARQQI